MIIIVNQIKKQIYNILSEDLKYNVMDNPYNTKERTFPYVILNLQNVTRDSYKNSYQYMIKYKIDIFSNYDGEKEILEMEQAIFNHMEKLYDNEFVTYFRESSFRIMDDKSTSVTRKHGIITYTIISTGGIVEDEQTDETN